MELLSDIRVSADNYHAWQPSGRRKGREGEKAKAKGFGERGFPFAFFLLLSISFLRLLRRLADIIRLILISNDQCCYPRLMLIVLPDIINLHLIYRYPTFIVISALSDITRNFSNDDGDVREDVEKAIGLLSKTATRHVQLAHPFTFLVSDYIIASQDVLWRT